MSMLLFSSPSAGSEPTGQTSRPGDKPTFWFIPHTHQEATFRKMVADGRLQIVAGMDAMPDVNMPGGESFIRQVLYGKGYYRRELGLDVTVGWQLDTFGHHAQIPQLLKLTGYESLWFFHGVSSWEVPSESLWEGIDGSRIGNRETFVRYQLLLPTSI